MFYFLLGCFALVSGFMTGVSKLDASGFLRVYQRNRVFRAMPMSEI
jgi:hypothetical protein